MQRILILILFALAATVIGCTSEVDNGNTDQPEPVEPSETSEPTETGGVAALTTVEPTRTPVIPPTFTPQALKGTTRAENAGQTPVTEGVENSSSTPEIITSPPITATMIITETGLDAGDLTTITVPFPSELAPQSPLPPPTPTTVNGLSVEQIVVMPEEVRQHVREIYQRGQILGRNSRAFSKLGDSLIATPSFLTPFDTGNYSLGVYEFLQPAIEYFAGSFERYGVALRPGLHAWGIQDPTWANKDWCQPNEDMLACEIRLNNPGVLLILIGTNDSGSPDGFNYNVRKVVEYTIEQGIIPVIVTKADRFEGPENTNNNILRQIATDMRVPLWDFDLVAETLPNRGLGDDNVHLTTFVENDYTLEEAYTSGHGVHNLTGLMVLEAIRQTIAPDQES